MWLQEALKNEAAKTRANRGTETAARDLRRLFTLMNLIAKGSAPSHYKLTHSGKGLLASAAGTDRNAQWRSAMHGLTLETIPGSISHPYRLLLRLMAANPGLEKQKLLLALEATDDSDGEFARIVQLSKKTVAQIVKNIGVSKSNAANAIKILPSIAQQLGDISEKKGACFPRAVNITTEEGSLFVIPSLPAIASFKSLSEVTPENIAASPIFSEGVSVALDLADAIALRKKRTIEHNNAVRSLATVLHNAKFKLYQYPYDCLAIDGNNRSLMAEIKTLDGSPADERQQAERALGQLKGYRHFSIPADCKKHPFVELAAFTRRPSNETIGFLRACGIYTTWQDGKEWRALGKSGEQVLDPGLLF